MKDRPRKTMGEPTTRDDVHPHRGSAWYERVRCFQRSASLHDLNMKTRILTSEYFERLDLGSATIGQILGRSKELEGRATLNEKELSSADSHTNS